MKKFPFGVSTSSPLRVRGLPVLAIALTGALAAAATFAPMPAAANPIERACLQSGREAANRATCACIGDAARQTLTGSQMRSGARFFRDPQRAQDVRQSSRGSDAALWAAWRRFGETAEAMCAS